MFDHPQPSRNMFFSLFLDSFYLNARFGDGNGLLLHGLVDGHLVFDLHFVELINATDTLTKWENNV